MATNRDVMAWVRGAVGSLTITALALVGGLCAADAGLAAAAPATPVTAPAYRVSSWTTAEGLPQNSVNDIVVLPNGDLWIATFGGLARFDGHAFHVLDIASDAGLPDNRVLAMVPAGRDGFWFLTLRGHLGRVRAGRAETVVPPPPAFEALGLRIDAKGIAYTRSVRAGVWRTDRGAWRQMLPDTQLTAGLHGLTTSTDGQFWAAQVDRLVQLLDDDVIATYATPAGSHDVFPRLGGGVWVATENGLLEFANGHLGPIDATPAIDGKVTVVAHESDDVLWVASSGSVSRLARRSDGRWRRDRLPLNFPPDQYIRALRLDGHGGVWIGTTGLGLHHVAPLPVRRFDQQHDLLAVTGLASDGRGGAFLVDWCRGLKHVDAAGHVQTVPLQRQWQGASANAAPCSIALAQGDGDAVWVRVEDRLFRVRRDALTLSPQEARLPKEPGSIVADGTGGLFVISRGGLVQHLAADAREQRRWRLPPPLISAALAPDGALWVGGQGTLDRLRDDRMQRPAAAMPHADVRDLLVEADGTVWFATYGGGLGRLRDGRVARITVAHGLPDNSLSRVLLDGADRFWIATNRGIAVASRSSLHEVADGRRARASVAVLGPERGVAEATFGDPAGFIDGAGIAWFGSIAGAVAIDTTRFPFSRATPRARIESVTVDDQRLAAGDLVVVPPHTSRVRLEFSATALSVAERVRYRFRVDDLDGDWIDVGQQRTVDWTPPAPGRHLLLVDAQNEDGVWSNKPGAIILDVRPAWWQTTWLRGGATVAAVLLLGGGMRWRTRRLERQHGDRLRVMEDQARAERHIAELRAQLDHVSRVALAGELAASLAHEVSQPLAAMVNNAEAGRRHLQHYLDRPEELTSLLDDLVADGLRASGVVRGLRSFLRPRATATAPLDLSAVVREMLPLVDRELRNQHVSLEVSLDEQLPPVDGVHVQLGQVVINLVLNACEAMEKIDGPRRLRIVTHALDGQVYLRVRDWGPGIDAAVGPRRLFDPFVTTKPDGLGMGLAICRAIAEAHGGKLSATELSDGTEFVLTLPACAAP